MTMHESYVRQRSGNLKRVYSALGNAKTAMRETAPHLRDYADYGVYDGAREVFNRRMEAIARLQVEVTEEAKQLQRSI